jgi:hypothetical protein
VRRLLSVDGSTHHLLWPRWATWSLVAVVVTALITIAITLNDIW